MPTPMVQTKQEYGGSVDGGNIPLLVVEADLVPIFYAYRFNPTPKFLFCLCRAAT
jgi:hypothetical protein